MPTTESKQRSGSFSVARPPSPPRSSSGTSVISVISSMSTSSSTPASSRKRQQQQAQQQAQHQRWDIVLLLFSLASFVAVNILYYRFTVAATRGMDNHPPAFAQDTAVRNISDAQDTTTKLMNTVCADPSTAHLRVADLSTSSNSPPVAAPRILCVVMTTKDHHNTKAKGVMDTWGSRCDGILFSSNENDSSIGAVNIHRGRTEADDGGMWSKLNATMHYVYENYSSKDYDWIIKAEDDAYLIPNNLRSFLMHQAKSTDIMGSPMIFGRTIQWPRLGALLHWQGWFADPQNQLFRRKLFQTAGADDILTYAHGGPGYAMNWSYLNRFVKALDSRNVVRGPRIAEDLGHAVTMRYRNIFPKETIDPDDHKQLFHPESPQIMFDNPSWLADAQKAIANRPGEDCCSKYSVSFHHLSPQAMHVLDYQLYNCHHQNQKDDSMKQ